MRKSFGRFLRVVFVLELGRELLSRTRKRTTSRGEVPFLDYFDSLFCVQMEAAPRAVGTTAPHEAVVAPNQAPVASSEIIISEPPARDLHSIPQASAQPPVLVLLRSC